MSNGGNRKTTGHWFGSQKARERAGAEQSACPRLACGGRKDRVRCQTGKKAARSDSSFSQKPEEMFSDSYKNTILFSDSKMNCQDVGLSKDRKMEIRYLESRKRWRNFQICNAASSMRTVFTVHIVSP